MKKMNICIAVMATLVSSVCCNRLEPFPDDVQGVDTSKYEYTSPWHKGYMDIHQISTGRGDVAFLILPDGTTMLVDMGDLGVNNYTQEIMGAKPSPARKPAEWVAKYVKHFAEPLGNDGKIDFAMMTHFHGDHIGAFDKLALNSEKRNYKLQGITHLAELVDIDRIVDRAWPGYDYPSASQVNSSNSGVANYISFMTARAADGKTNQKFVVGSTSQFGLLKDKSYDFRVLNLAGNLEYFNGSGVSKYSLSTNDENEYSLAVRISYGKFDWYTGGDIKNEGYEEAISKACGATDVVVCNHHAYSDAMHSAFVKNMDATAWVIPCWDYYHPQPDPLKRMLAVTGADEKLVFSAGLVESNRIRLGADGKKIKAGHIMIRVYEGGDTFQVFVLNDGDEYYEIIDKTEILKSR
ncbi:MAG: hypothetical protein MJY67_01395 [Bacteroidales bacterium]|nr:hypothetical protein [Bacteroidales bacterium]